MKMGCFAEYVIKYILFVLNLMFTFGGLVLLILGIIIHNPDMDISHGNLAALSAIVIGSAIFVIAFFGFCGAIMENRCFLATYVILMIVLMIVKVVMGVVIFVEKDEILDELREWMADTFDNNRNRFLQVQSAFSCCGTTGAAVYLPGAVPASCCPASPCNVVNSFDPCFVVLNDFFDTAYITIGVIVLVIAGIELIAAIFGFCLSRHIGKKQSVELATSS